MQQQIEHELRVRIPLDGFDEAFALFNKSYALESTTDRVSFMSFFSLDSKQFDLRIRVTNHKAEVVLKMGDLHAGNRTEMSQPVQTHELLGLIKMFAHLSSDNLIASRTTYNFTDNKNVMISLVKSETVAYIEYELLNETADVADPQRFLGGLIAEHGFASLDQEGFKTLNTDLDKDDWQFDGSPTATERLEKLLTSHLSAKA